MNRTTVIAFLTSLILCVTALHAETISFDHEVRDIAIDHDGVVWIGTDDNGVFSYDGVEFTQYTTRNDLPQNSIRTIAVDNNNVKWFGYTTLSSFDGENWIHYDYSKEYGKSWPLITGIVFDSNNVAWLSTSGYGAYRFDGEKLTQYTVENSGLYPGETTDDGIVWGNSLGDVAVDHDDVVWFIADGGVSCFDGENWRTWSTEDGVPESRGHSAYVDSGNIKWFGFKDGICSFDGTAWTQHSALINNDKPMDYYSTYDIAEDRDGLMWFSSLFGVIRYDGVTASVLSGNYSGPYVRAITVGPDNTIWFGSQTGLYSYNGEQVRSYEYEEHEDFTFVEAVREGDYTLHRIARTDYPFDVATSFAEYDGDRWFTLSDTGAAVFDGAEWTVYTPSNSGIASANPTCVTIDQDGIVWVGSDMGVSRFDGIDWQTFTSEDGLPVNDVRAAAIDKDNTLWIGTFGGGAASFDGSTWSVYTTSDGLCDDEIISIAVDSRNNIWFGGNTGGTSIYDGTAFTTYTVEDGLAGNHVNAIAVDSNDRAYLATGKVSIFDGTSWCLFDSSNGLLRNDIISVFVDADNHPWFGSENENAYRFADGVLYHYNYSFMYGQHVNVLAVDSQGWKWFGTPWGLSSVAPRIPPSAADEEDQPSSLKITGNYPNPFNPSTTISFTLPVDGLASLTVYNLAGQKVRTLTDEPMATGNHTIVWDGRDDVGNVIAAGIYLTRLNVDGMVTTGKMMLVK